MARFFWIVVLGLSVFLAKPAEAQRYLTMKDTPVDAKTLEALHACVAAASRGPKIERKYSPPYTPEQGNYVWDTGEGIRAHCEGKLAQTLNDRFVQLGTSPSYSDYPPNEKGLDSCSCNNNAKHDVYCEIEVETMSGEAFSCYGKIDHTGIPGRH